MLPSVSNGFWSVFRVDLLVLIGIHRAPGQVESLKLVRIRNPWGQTEWKGAFADHDQMWNKYPDLKDKLGYEFGPDGTWWMRFDDWVTASD